MSVPGAVVGPPEGLGRALEAGYIPCPVTCSEAVGPGGRQGSVLLCPPAARVLGVVSALSPAPPALSNSWLLSRCSLLLLQGTRDLAPLRPRYSDGKLPWFCHQPCRGLQPELVCLTTGLTSRHWLHSRELPGSGSHLLVRFRQFLHAWWGCLPLRVPTVCSLPGPGGAWAAPPRGGPGRDRPL